MRENNNNFEFKVEAMTYHKRKDIKSKLLLFIIAFVFVCAVAFTGLYFAYENSRVEKLNSNLNNIQTENPPEEDNDFNITIEGETNSTFEGETNASGDPALTIQVVSGIGINPYSLENGILDTQEEAELYSDKFYINIKNYGGKNATARSKIVRNNGNKSSKITIDSSVVDDTNLNITLQIEKIKNASISDGKLALMYKTQDGVMVDYANFDCGIDYFHVNYNSEKVFHEIVLFDTGNSTSLLEELDENLTLYVVFTREVEISVYDSPEYEVSYLSYTANTGSYYEYSEWPFVTRYNKINLYTETFYGRLTSIKMYNCIFNAVGSGLLPNSSNKISIKKEYLYVNEYTFTNDESESITLKNINGSFMADIYRLDLSVHSLGEYTNTLQDLWGFETEAYRHIGLNSLGEFDYSDRITSGNLFELFIPSARNENMTTSGNLNGFKISQPEVYVKGDEGVLNNTNTLLLNTNLGNLLTTEVVETSLGNFYENGIHFFDCICEVTTAKQTYYCENPSDLQTIFNNDTNSNVSLEYRKDSSLSAKNSSSRFFTFEGDVKGSLEIKSGSTGTIRINGGTAYAIYNSGTGSLSVNSGSSITRLKNNNTSTITIASGAHVKNLINNSTGNITINNGAQVDNITNNSTGIININYISNPCNITLGKLKGTTTSDYIVNISGTIGAQINITVEDNSLNSSRYYVVKSTNTYMQNATYVPVLTYTEGLGTFSETTTSPYYTYLDAGEIINIDSWDTFEAKLVNHSGEWDENAIYRLTEDITLPSTFAGIGSSSNNFNGTLDGNGHMITFQGSGGLFNYTHNATICNLVVTGSIGTNKTENFGGLITSATGNTLIYNIYMNATIGSSVNSNYHIGGMIRANSGDAMFINCVVDKAVADSSGGNIERSNFVGYTTGKVNFINCRSATPEFNVDTSSRRGLFVGYCAYGERLFYLYNCYLYGERYDNPIGDWYTGSFYEEEYTFGGELNEFINTNNPYTITQIDIKDKDGNPVESINNLFISNFENKEIYLYNWVGGYMLVKDKINTQESLLSLCNGGNFAYRAARIISDITLTNWTGFEEFAGYLDGNGNTITFGSNCSQGITKYLLSTGKITYLNTEGTINATSGYVGAIAGQSSGGIGNCTNNATINADGYNYIGGIVGSDNSSALGAIMVSDCTNNGDISGYMYVGGIAGSASYMSGTTNFGTITGEAYVGGLAGTVKNVWYTNINNGVVNCNWRNAGGLFGSVTGEFVSVELSNTGPIIATGITMHYFGGLIGLINSNATINLNIIENSGNITFMYKGSNPGYAKNISRIGGAVGAIIDGNDNIGTIVGAKYTGTINLGPQSNDKVNLNIFRCGGLVGTGHVENSTFEGNIELYTLTSGTFTDNDGNSADYGAQMGGIVGCGSVTNCTFNGNVELTGTNPVSFYYISHRSGNATNCVFNGDVTYTGTYNSVTYNNTKLYADTLNIVGNTNETTTARSATQCFIKADSTYILTNDAMANSYITYTNCSTFKDVEDSLVYNGYSFGSLVDALGDGVNTYWIEGENGIPTLTDTATPISKVLTIREEDNLNAMNNLIEETSGTFTFDGYIFSFGTPIELSESFTGLGSAYALNGGTFIGTYAEYNSESGLISMSDIDETNKENVDVYLTNSPLFYNVRNVELYGIATASMVVYVEDSDAIEKVYTPYAAIAFMAQNSTFNNCINFANIYSNESNIGGICSLAIDCDFEKCVNVGNIEGAQSRVMKNIGGIIGTYYHESDEENMISNCYNLSNITNGDFLGGLIGCVYGNSSSIQIVNCVSDGIYQGKNYLSGMIGFINSGTCNIYNSTSLAIISQTKIGFDSTTTAIALIGSGTLNIYNTYFFGEMVNVDTKNFVLGVNTFENIGYNINNTKNMYVNGTLNDSLVYVTENPVWSSNAYIRWLIINETETMLNGENTKLQLNWNTNYEFDYSFWTNILSKEAQEEENQGATASY